MHQKTHHFTIKLFNLSILILEVSAIFLDQTYLSLEFNLVPQTSSWILLIRCHALKKPKTHPKKPKPNHHCNFHVASAKDDLSTDPNAALPQCLSNIFSTFSIPLERNLGKGHKLKKL